MASSSAKYSLFRGIIAVLVGISIGFAVMSSSSPLSSSQVPNRAALIMQASIDDIGWGTLHYQGLLALRDQLGYEVAFSESVAPASWETAARDYAENNYKYIIMGGPEFTDVTINVAPDYPDTIFIVTAAVPPAEGESFPSNMIGIDPINEQSGYLAGILAGGMTKTNRVAIVAGFDFPNLVRMYEAFKLGLVTQNPNVTPSEVFIGSFEDVSLGYEASRSQIDAGADIVFQDLDRAAFGVVNAIRERQGTLLISNTNDQVFLAPEVTLTSALMNHTDLILRSVQQLDSGELNGGEFHRWGIEAGVVGLAPYHQTEGMIPADLKAKIEDLKMQMTNGTFTVPEIYEKDGYRNFL